MFWLFLSHKTWWWFIRVMSAVVKKSFLCCLNKKRLYLGAVKLPLSSGWRQWFLGPWPSCRGFSLRGKSLPWGSSWGHKAQRFLDGTAGWPGAGLQASSWFVQLVESADAAPSLELERGLTGAPFGWRKPHGRLVAFPSNLGRGLIISRVDWIIC